MSAPIRLTYPTAMVLQALDRGVTHGFDIIEATGVRSGTVYPVLRRLEEAGLVRSRWEPVAVARRENRPPRKYYELTPTADDLLAAARDRFPALSAVPNGATSTSRTRNT
jgi:PadR family transcriptional regulator